MDIFSKKYFTDRAVCFIKKKKKYFADQAASYAELQRSFASACISADSISWALRCNKRTHIMILIRAVCSASLKLPAGSISHLKSN